jgi:hypothetical protein
MHEDNPSRASGYYLAFVTFLQHEFIHNAAPWTAFTAFGQGGRRHLNRGGRRMKRTRARTSLACAAGALGLLAPFLAVGGADAIGNNRVVSRSCGTNYVSSGSWGSNGAWAQTLKNSGNCAGRLSVAFQAGDGYRTARVYGTSQSAYDDVPATGRGGWRYGLHWGCDACNVTTS